MALNRLLVAFLLLGLLPGAAWLAHDASATFAASPGFSGRAGATCLACHTPTPLLHEPAFAHLEGLPDAWEAGQTYRLVVRVTGGPPALPSPAPQGGFDLSIDGGSFAVPEGFEGKLRVTHPQEITYLPEGTLMREWLVDWTAPGLESRPTERKAWLAVLSANGNHVIATNASDGGERFDSAANLTASFPASASTVSAWREMPLLAPVANASVIDEAVLVSGLHADGNATELWWRLDGGPWERRDTGLEWRIRFEGLSAGGHTLYFRSEGEERRSADQALSFTVPGFAFDLPGSRDSPSVGLAPLVLLLVTVVTLRSRK